MRVIAGEWRGRTIVAPPGRAVRPTLDRVREAWLSIVGYAVVGARVLDLFAGSGALGIEALSRGADHCDFVDLAPRSLEAIRKNLATLGAADGRARVVRADAMKFVAPLAESAYDIAFADPPYESRAARALAEQWVTKPFARLLSVEHARAESMPAGGDTRRYGDSFVTFYRACEP